MEDIHRFLDTIQLQQVVLAGLSFAGIEMPHLARRYPERVAGLVFLDALFPHLDPEPDLGGDPVWSDKPPTMTAADLASVENYLAYHWRHRSDLAASWCEAIEADLLDKIMIQDDGRVISIYDDALMARIAGETWPIRDPQYEKVRAPMLAIVPDGDYHYGLPPDADDALRLEADRFWQEVVWPWIRQRTTVFSRCAPAARVVERDVPNHLILIARQEETVAAVKAFQTSIDRGN